MEDLTWYIAEFVVSVDLWGDEPHEYRIENYVIKAKSAEEAYDKALQVTKYIGSSFENQFGEDENHTYLGFHNLTEHNEANNGDVIHICNTYLLDVDGNPPKPRVRNKDELWVFINHS
jgi:hypothetical protein